MIKKGQTRIEFFIKIIVFNTLHRLLTARIYFDFVRLKKLISF